MAKRHQTYFGIPIPPFKCEKFGAHSTTIRFVITGKVPSKKNNQQAVAIRKFSRDWLKKQSKSGLVSLSDAIKAVNMVKGKMRGNTQYLQFLKEIKPIIRLQMDEWRERLSHKNLIFPISKATASFRFYFKDRYITDTVNKQQTIQDILVDCGVIANDDYKTLNPIKSESACFYEEIIYDIVFVSLTFNL